MTDNILQEVAAAGLGDVKISPAVGVAALAAEVVRLRARVEAADKLAEAVATVPGDSAYPENWDAWRAISDAALAAYEATK